MCKNDGLFCVANLAMEAEALSIACEFLESFSHCSRKNYIIRLNHVSLVAAILYYHQVVSKKHQTVCNFLNKSKVGNLLRAPRILNAYFLICAYVFRLPDTRPQKPTR